MTTHTMPSIIGGNICCDVIFNRFDDADLTIINRIMVKDKIFDLDDLSRTALNRLTKECEKSIINKG